MRPSSITSPPFSQETPEPAIPVLTSPGLSSTSNLARPSPDFARRVDKRRNESNALPGKSLTVSSDSVTGSSKRKNKQGSGRHHSLPGRVARMRDLESEVIEQESSPGGKRSSTLSTKRRLEEHHSEGPESRNSFMQKGSSAPATAPAKKAKFLAKRHPHNAPPPEFQVVVPSPIAKKSSKAFTLPTRSESPQLTQIKSSPSPEPSSPYKPSQLSQFETSQHKPKTGTEKTSAEPENVRRSGRRRVKPLQYWRNERIVYCLVQDEDGDVVPTIRQIIRASSSDEEASAEIKRKRRKTT